MCTYVDYKTQANELTEHNIYFSFAKIKLFIERS